MSENKASQIVNLERRIVDLQACLPRHSVPPAMLIELEDLEEELMAAREESECA